MYVRIQLPRVHRVFHQKRKSSSLLHFHLRRKYCAYYRVPLYFKPKAKRLPVALRPASNDIHPERSDYEIHWRTENGCPKYNSSKAMRSTRPRNTFAFLGSSYATGTNAQGWKRVLCLYGRHYVYHAISTINDP